MEEQKTISEKGGTMRLGNYPCKIFKETKAYSLFKEELVLERHRHRYEFNNLYKERFIEKGMVFSGINEELNLVEMIELPSNRFYLATQSHPEFKSRPNRPHPLFLGFIEASIKK